MQGEEAQVAGFGGVEERKEARPSRDTLYRQGFRVFAGFGWFRERVVHSSHGVYSIISTTTDSRS
jgi:hypothetical protein